LTTRNTRRGKLRFKFLMMNRRVRRWLRTYERRSVDQCIKSFALSLLYFYTILLYQSCSESKRTL
jgi:hypothetical protein